MTIDDELKNNFQKIKVANCLAIGGMIGAGKSTLSEALGKKLNVAVSYEISSDDELQNVLLKRQYEGDKTSAIAFQIYFFCTRFNKYRTILQHQPLVIFDRTIFEDRIFAHQNMTSDPIMFGFYDAMWRNKIKELIYSIGVPKLYVILDIDWNNFKSRLFDRGRQAEIEHFPQNEFYFRSLLRVYKDYLIDVCRTYGMNYLILDATLPTNQQVEIVIQEVKKQQLNMNI